MDNEQAVVYAVIRANSDITTVKVIENVTIAPANVVGILAFHIEAGNVTWSNKGGGRVYNVTEKGETAYKNWLEIPF